MCIGCHVPGTELSHSEELTHLICRTTPSKCYNDHPGFQVRKMGQSDLPKVAQLVGSSILGSQTSEHTSPG